MPRQAHGRPLQPGKTANAAKKRPAKNRRLNALEIAERENPDDTKVRQHRLGVVDDDSDEPRTRDDDDERSSKRRKVDNGQEDDMEEGSDLEGNRWHVGVEDEDEDSDLDSDAAFGESDEEKFADFAFGGSSSTVKKAKKPARTPAADLGENNDDEEAEEDLGSDDDEDDLGDEAVDLATAWDMDDKEEAQLAKKKRKRNVHEESDVDAEEQSQADSEEDEESEDELSQLSLSEDEGDHSRLQSFVEGLSTGATAGSMRKQQDYKNLPEKPSQFGLSTSKISAADLMQYIKDPRQRQSLKILQNNDDKGNEAYKGGIPGKLAPPLAKRQQDRLDREAAYDETKKELEKWVDTVKHNRRAEHIAFPLVDPAAAGALNSKQLGPTSRSQPMNSLESTIQNIMVESGLLSQNKGSLDDQEQAYEELLEKTLPLEEVQARRAELRKARELMFREEIRARRIKKIKSKAYRRVHRKERQKDELERRGELSAQGLLDSEEEREKNDRRRAEERMGARHRESKWAKSVKVTGRAAWDDDVRHSVTDLAKRDEELRRRIEGKTIHDSDESEHESSENDEFSESEDERNHYQAKLGGLEEDVPDSTETRLSAMAFMKRAEASRKTANDAEIRSLRRSLRAGDGEGTDGSASDGGLPVGRRKFGSNSKVAVSAPVMPIAKSEFEERESDTEWNGLDDGEEKEQPPTDKVVPKPKTVTSSAPVTLQTSVQPQSIPNVGKAKVSTASKEAPKPASKVNKPAQRVKRVSQTTLEDDYTSPSGSEDEHDANSALAKALFAGPDEVEQDFAQEKRELEEEEGDQVIDNGLPGWGSWTGEGISKKAQKRAKGRFLTTVKGVAKDKRQDAKLDRIIINEKQMKKNGKYLATELPHPFESRQQYERSLRLPLGPEWTTKTTFQDATKPRVLMKQGIIRPMAKPLV
ncbi:Utp14 protein-domain-containing protein [Exophiala viscosa]|uniref:Utp14 protein-domain-containing protein n=1 Tax=Exophiala viscosa TaxID=2486360 RepID=UPI00219D4634|nr:Utp14 protein-domain-containing protein [Exophiala viscosa]